eukprot:258763-Chlamydomonas_euryale.AAC.11
MFRCGSGSNAAAAFTMASCSAAATETPPPPPLPPPRACHWLNAPIASVTAPRERKKVGRRSPGVAPATICCVSHPTRASSSSTDHGSAHNAASGPPMPGSTPAPPLAAPSRPRPSAAAAEAVAPRATGES